MPHPPSPCPRSIALEDPIQKTLSINYRGTQALLGLAERLLGPRLAALVHVSTGFVGMHLPCGSTVREELLPLMLGDRPVGGVRVGGRAGKGGWQGAGAVERHGTGLSGLEALANEGSAARGQRASKILHFVL